MDTCLSKAALFVFLFSSIATANKQCPQVESQVDVDLDSFLAAFIQHKRETALMQIDELVDILLKSQCVCKNSCLNGGTRTDLPNGGYKCVCACQFTGIICETDLSTMNVTTMDATTDMSTTNIMTTNATTTDATKTEVTTTNVMTTDATTKNVLTTDATTTDATKTDMSTTNIMTTDGTTNAATTSATTTGSTECREFIDSTEVYTGNQSLTFTKKTCQRWDSQTPHKHNYTDAGKFDGNITNVSQAENYCRNPNDKAGGPWCFTTDPAKRLEYCHIPYCPGIGCQQTQIGAEYNGTISQAGKDHCVRWEDVQPNKFTPTKFSGGITNLSQAENYCRNPDKYRLGPWCYTSVTPKTWKRCKVPVCQGCRVPAAGSAEDTYGGTTSTTESGLTCQRWDSQSPHSHTATKPAYFNTVPPLKHINEAENYCQILRDYHDTERMFQPWCYTTATGTKKQFCKVPICYS